MLCKVKGSGKT